MMSDNSHCNHKLFTVLPVSRMPKEPIESYGEQYTLSLASLEVQANRRKSHIPISPVRKKSFRHFLFYQKGGRREDG